MRTLLASLVLLASAAASAAVRDESAPYYPHWAARDGSITPRIMNELPPGTIIGAHHGWPLAELKRILDFPGKRFRIAWYAESNIATDEDPVPAGTPVARRIAEASAKQKVLAGKYGKHRFANLIELDAEREKRSGELAGDGNRPADWLADAEAAKAAGFGYIAKSPTVAQVRELRSKLGAGFVSRIVYEDVTAGPDATNPGYRRDAKAMAKRGERVTLIVHEGAYGGFPATPLERARAVIGSDFDLPNVEAYWGRPNGFMKLKSFANAGELTPDGSRR